MTNILRFIQFLALGTWLGSIIYFSFAVAPALFATLQSRDQAGAIVGIALGRLHHLGIIAGVLYLLASLALARSPKVFVQPAVVAVIAMLAFTVISQHRITPRMAQLRTQMVSVDSTPPENPLRAEFDRLHKVSVRLEGSVLLFGLIALFLTARHRASTLPPSRIRSVGALLAAPLFSISNTADRFAMTHQRPF